MPTTMFKCERCGTVFSDRENAEMCERSHIELGRIAAQRFNREAGDGPYPHYITCVAADGARVEYERRRRR